MGFLNIIIIYTLTSWQNWQAEITRAQIQKLLDDFLLSYEVKKSASTQTECDVIETLLCSVVQDTIKREAQLIGNLFSLRLRGREGGREEIREERHSSCALATAVKAITSSGRYWISF